ncbi:MAG: hypothetical protein A3J28_01390 [Acidobacteria bacterium RIFCSPLOWO2_12_FULL_60_22]|nr:MAG: hypothetical protein A3J28_01390 [Acidobacteria bacterium RIFCSPLOWO2_12_FULL_60_22]
MANPDPADPPAEHSVPPAGPCVVVIFGATGDLTKRKLIPAIYYLAKSRLLPADFAVVGLANSEMNDEAFRQEIGENLQTYLPEAVEKDCWDWLSARLHFLGGEFKDPKLYERLRKLLAQVDSDHRTCGNYLFYLATNPILFCDVVQQLGMAGLARQEPGQWRRVVIEKPFGRDLESARALNLGIRKTLEEKQIFRIDHYLGKETVQNILVFRFSNGIFEPIWNRRYIDHVQITVAETVGVERRGGYYEEAGALRDMVPSHIFQLLALTAMEPP